MSLWGTGIHCPATGRECPGPNCPCRQRKAKCPYCTTQPGMDCYYDQTCPGCVARMGDSQFPKCTKSANANE